MAQPRKPDPLFGILADGRAVPIAQWRAAQPRSEPPHICPDLDLMGVLFPSIGWGGWRSLRGGGPLSLLRWLLTLGRITEQEQVRLDHECMTREGRCHRWEGLTFCYCGRRWEDRQWERDYRAALAELGAG